MMVLGYPGVSEWPQSQYGVQISGRVHDSTYDGKHLIWKKFAKKVG